MILSTGLLAYACLLATPPAPATDEVPAPSVEPTEASAMPALSVSTTAPQDEGGVSISYTYVEVGWAQNDLDDISDEVDVTYIDGSFALGERLYVIAGLERHDLGRFDTDANLLSAGAGLRLDVMPKVDVFGDFSLLFSDSDSDLNALDGSELGYKIRAGGRWMALDWDRGGLEVQGDLLWLDLDNWIGSDDSFTGFEVGARAHFLKLFSVGLMYSILGDDEQVAVNGRVSF